MSDKFDMPAAGPNVGWEERGGWVVSALCEDYGLTKEQAAGIVGNLGFESGGFQHLHEIGQPEGLGGYGWGQWTAVRRETFLAFCKQAGLPWQSDEANFTYLEHEFDNEYGYILNRLAKTTTLEDAVFRFGHDYEAPGGTTDDYLPGFDGRLNYAKRALAGIPAPTPKPVPIPSPGPVEPQVQVSSEALSFWDKVKGWIGA